MPRAAPAGDATRPTFVCRDTAARECEISVDTWDLWVRDGFAPQLAPLKSPDALRSLWKAWKTEHPAVPADATLHDLRAMAVCDCRLSGVAHQQIADQLGMSPSMVTRYSKAIDKKANAEAGMRTMEQATNENMKRVWGAAETRG